MLDGKRCLDCARTRPAADGRTRLPFFCADLFHHLNLEVTFRDVRADDVRGSAHWEARYTFTLTGLPVHNVIEAAFTFKDGLILQGVNANYLLFYTGLAIIVAMTANVFVGRARRGHGNG